MKLLYTSDLHGSKSHYQQVLDALREESADVLILGGDMLPDGDRGIPYYRVVRYIQEDFKTFLQDVREINPDIRILTVFGNHDWIFSIDEFAELQKNGLLQMIEYDRRVTIEDLTFLGLSYCPPAPYWIKDFERRDREQDCPTEFGGYTWCVRERKIVSVTGRKFFSEHPSIEQMLGQCGDIEAGFVFVSHAPPANSNLDLLLDGNPVGSHAVHEFIETKKPIISLHGHLHESPIVSGHCTDKISETLAINPGQNHDKLCAVWWNSDEPDRIRHTQNWSV